MMPTVNCISIVPNSWTIIRPGEQGSDFSADIWRIRVVNDEDHINHLRSFLAIDELEKNARYYREKDRQRHITSRAFLRNILSGYLDQPPKDIQFAIGTNKKPVLQNHSPLHFNISHTGEWILIAIGKNEIGIDVEKIDLDVSHEDIFPISFNDQEIAAIKSSPVPGESFYLYWTRKEALTKATAKGIDDDLKKIPSLDGTHTISNSISGNTWTWLVTSFKVDDTYIGSVASDTRENLRFLEAKT